MSTLLNLGEVFDAANGCEIYIYNDAGSLATATVALTITLPDGSTTTPSVTTPSTGRYQSSYKPTQAGTHYVRWVATSVGGVSGEDTAYEDSFTVSASTNSFLSLAEAKEYLNISSSDHDDELLVYVEIACDLAQQVADSQFARKSVVDTLSASGTESFLNLSHRPVISVTSVTERGTTLTASTQYATDLRWGRLYRMVGAYDRTVWGEGTRHVVATYVAGYAIIPTQVRFATLVILDHLWKTQRGGSALGGRPFDDDISQVAGTNWFIPNRARDILLDYRPPAVA